MNINLLHDGVYFVPSTSTIEFFNVETSYDHEKDGYDVVLHSTVEGKYKRTEKDVKEYILENSFLKEKETLWLGRAYEVYGFILLDTEPMEIKSSGSGFNYGSCNYMEIPEKGFVIILAEND